MANKKATEPGYFVNFDEQIPDENTGNTYEVLGDDMSNVHINRKATFINSGSQKGTPLSAQNFNDLQNFIKDYIDKYTSEQVIFFSTSPTFVWNGITIVDWLKSQPNMPTLPPSYRVEITITDLDRSQPNIISFYTDPTRHPTKVFYVSNGITLGDSVVNNSVYFHFIRAGTAVHPFYSIADILTQQNNTVGFVRLGDTNTDSDGPIQGNYSLKVIELKTYTDNKKK